MPFLVLPAAWFNGGKTPYPHVLRTVYLTLAVLWCCAWVDARINPWWLALLTTFYWVPLAMFTRAFTSGRCALLFEPVTATLAFAYGWLALWPSWRAALVYTLALWLGAWLVPEGGFAWFRGWRFWGYMWRNWLGLTHNAPPLTTGLRRPVVIAAWPHGIATFGTFAVFGAHGRPDGDNRVVIACTPALFFVPLCGLLVRMGGAVSCSAASITRNLGAGRHVVVLPEGNEGILAAGRDLALLRHPMQKLDTRRTGFLRVAAAAACPVRVVYVAGEAAQAWRSGGPRIDKAYMWTAKHLRFVLPLAVALFLGRVPRGPLVPRMSAAIDVTQQDAATAMGEVRACLEQLVADK